MAPLSGQPDDFGEFFSSASLLGSFAPLLILFGEQVTKQFISQMTGWPDFIIFSMAPVGILTGVVSAIRLRGSNTLKAIIGR